MDISEMYELAVRHKSRIDTIKNEYINDTKVLQSYQQELDVLNAEYQDTTYIYEYLDELIKSESNKFIDSLTSVLKYGVENIFYDCCYSVKIVSEDGKAVIKLVYNDGSGLEPDIQNCGGGIRTVIGVLMQIFFIYHLKVKPILIVDEGFSQVSSQYLPNLFSVIDELCQNNGLKILLITHDVRIQDYAYRHYEIINGNSVLVK